MKKIGVVLIGLFLVGLVCASYMGGAEGFKKVSRIECWDEVGEVYNFRVSDESNYFAEGVLVHNVDKDLSVYSEIDYLHLLQPNNLF